MSKKNKKKKQSDQNKQVETKQLEPGKSKEELEAELEDIDSKLESIQKEIVIFNADIQKREKDLIPLKSKIESLENELKELNISGFSKIDTKPFNIQFPSTLLPKIGILYQNKSRDRFLTIQHWEDFEKGKEEANRLNAILCINKQQKKQIQKTDNEENSDVW